MQTPTPASQAKRIPSVYSTPVAAPSTPKVPPPKNDTQANTTTKTTDPPQINNKTQQEKIEGITISAILQFVWHKIIHIYGNSVQTVVGTTVSGRDIPIKNIENSVGLFINTLPLVVSHDQKNCTIIDAIKTIQKDLNEINSQSFVHLATIQKNSERIFDTLFVYENYPDINKGQVIQKLNMVLKESIEKIDYPLSCCCFEIESKIHVNIDYAAEIISQVTVKKIVSMFEFICTQIIDHSIMETNCLTPFEKAATGINLKVNDLRYFNDSELNELKVEWHKNDASFPDELLIHQVFEEQVEKTPNNVALVYKSKSYTYLQLNEITNKITHYLTENYIIEPDDIIALFVDRSEYTVISILSVLKCGAAYLPIDPTYPTDRINIILCDSKPKLVLTNACYKSTLQKIVKGINSSTQIETIDDGLFQDQVASNKVTETQSNNLAYVIYTSGSTGKPKGTLIEHRNVVCFIYAFLNELKMKNSCNSLHCLQYANYVFDVHFLDLTISIFAGNALHVVDNDMKFDLTKLEKYVKEKSIHFALLPPALLNTETLIPVSVLGVAGEKPDKNILEYYKQNNIAIINMYGPTECTIVASFNRYKSNGETNIGFPLANIKYYVLSSSQQLVPVGALGELYIGGDTVSRGYLNRPELTEERFIKNPFQTEEEKQDKRFCENGRNSRLYKTGDLVRRLPEGDFEYIGRTDSQVKIRGFRIELGEIETVLSSYPDVIQSYVSVKNHDDSSKNKYLIGYYVSQEKLNEDRLFNFLRTKLPDYMIPTAVIHLTKFPLNINGKIDKKALPEPTLINSNGYIAPRNEIEAQMCGIWAEVLGLSNDVVGINSDFFSMGGDSIMSILIVSKIRKQLKIEVTVKDIFTNRNIQMLYDNVIQHFEAINEIIEMKTEQGLLTGAFKLLPIQSWFFQAKLANQNYFNQSFIIKVGTELDINKLQISCQKLIEHHDMLRATFDSSNFKNILQQYSITPNWNFNTIDIKKETNENEIEKTLTEYQSRFDIEKGPLISITYLYNYHDGSVRIHFAIHHLIIDTVSWRILVDDLRNIYNGLSLGPKRSSYRQWVQTVDEYALNNSTEKQFWNQIQNEFNDSKSKIFFDTIQIEQVESVYKITFDEETTDKMLKKSNTAFNTQINDILLTALAHTLFELTNNTINFINLEGHGREEIDDSIDISRTVGWFTIMYPVKIQFKSNNWRESLISVKENLRKIPNKGIGYGSIIGYNETLPKIAFNYLGVFEEMSVRKTDWCFVNERCGLTSDPNNKYGSVLSLKGFIKENRLNIEITGPLKYNFCENIGKKYELSLKELIDYTFNIGEKRSFLTTSDISNVISQTYLDELQETNDISNVFLANSLQEGFLYHSLYHDNTDDAYLTQTVLEYRMILDIEKFKKAWQYAQVTYPILRTSFAWNEQLVQIIYKESSIDWRFLNHESYSETDSKDKYINELIQNDRKELYKLNSKPLFRVYLVMHKQDLFTCIFSFHHIILDGWSHSKLFDYVHTTYLNLINKKEIDQTIEYAYVDAQKYIQEHMHELDNFWKTYLDQITEKPDLRGLLNVENRQNGLNINNYRVIKNQQSVKLLLNTFITSRLKAICQVEGITISSILQFVWHKILHIYGNSVQTVVGTTVSGRDIPIKNIENSVGLFINTLPLVVSHDQKNCTIIDAIKTIQKDLNEINSQSFVHLVTIQKNSERIFDTLFVYENYPESQTMPYFKVESKEDFGKEDYPLSCCCFEIETKIHVNIAYAAEIISQVTVKKIASMFEFICTQIIDNSNIETKSPLQQKATGINKKVSDLQFLTDLELNELKDKWDKNVATFPAELLIHQVFEEQVKKAPNNVALVYKSKSYTYLQLNEITNKIAHYLTENYIIEPDDIIALFIDRSEYTVISILSVLKCGAAYLPIDPTYPTDRINTILCDSKPKLVLTNACFKSTLHEIVKSINSSIQIQAIDDDFFQDQNATNMLTKTKSNNLAYVIYTSGSTGAPKGVMIEHKGVVNLAIALPKALKLENYNQQLKCLFFANYVFDAHVSEICIGIFAGNVLHIVDDETRYDLEKLNVYITDHCIDFAGLPPGLINTNLLLPLKIIALGGEKSNKHLLDFYSKNKIFTINWYGPTECTDTATINHYSNNGDTNIGLPITNVIGYVLSSTLKLVPKGAIGELYIGGVSLARGYLNRDKLNEDSFIQNPFQTEEEKQDKRFCENGRNSRLYKTGDLVRRLPEGDFEYIGRNDSQVKIRGFRIELGEIEAVLSSYPDVIHSYVSVKNHDHSSKNKYLIGYYVSQEKLNEDRLFNFLRTKLPDYMIPTAVVHLTKFPLNINGKIDNKALPEPTLINSNGYIAPRNEIETQMCGIWAEVLGLSNDVVGINSDFFSMGGDSIMSILIVSKIRKQLKIKVTVKDIFTNRNIQMLYDNVIQHFEAINEIVEVKTEQGLLTGAFKLLPIQSWFFQAKLANHNYFNQSFIIKVGTELDINKLQISCQKLIEHHDMLRATFDSSNFKNILQQYSITPNWNFNTIDIKKETNENEIEKTLTEYQSRFDIEKGPLISITYLYNYHDGSVRIHFAIHHLIIDTVSWRILVDDLGNIYNGINLEPKRSSYRQWVQTVDEFALNNSTEKQFWNQIQNEFNDSKSKTFFDTIQIENVESQYKIRFDEETTDKLLKKSNIAFKTQINDILLTALAHTLFELTNNTINFINLEGHGREEIDDSIDISRTVGWFTIMYPVKIQFKSNNWRESLISVKENLRKIPNKGIGYGSIIGYNETLPKIAFNYLGVFEEMSVRKTDWCFVNERCGLTSDPNNKYGSVLSLKGFIKENRLNIEITGPLKYNFCENIGKKYELSLKELIDYTFNIGEKRSFLTTSDISNVISQTYLDELQETNDISNVFLANSLQEGFLYHSLYHDNTDDAYLTQTVLEYRMILDIEKFKKAWQYAQVTYPILRTSFAWNEQLVQIIYKESSIDWRFLNHESYSDTDSQDKYINELIQNDRKELYKLNSKPLFRVYLVMHKQDLFTCIFSFHHIILDGWSHSKLFDYVHTTYLNLINKKEIDRTIEYAYVDAQKYIQEHMHELDNFWKTYLDQITEKPDLRGLLNAENRLNGTNINNYRVIKNQQSVKLLLNTFITNRLKEICQVEGITISAILQFVWHKILHIYGNSVQTVVGTTVSGRDIPIKNIENSVGLFINTLPLVVSHDQKNCTIIDAIKTIQKDLNEINSQSFVHLATIQKNSERIFDTLFVYENYPESQTMPYFKVESKEDFGKEDYPLSCCCFEIESKIHVKIDYAAEIISQVTVKKIASMFEFICTQIIDNSNIETKSPLQQKATGINKKVSDLQFLTDLELNELKDKWDKNVATFPAELLIHQVFEEQVKKAPNNVALVYKSKSYTYLQLNEITNKIAHYLTENYIIEPDDIIALFIDRSEYTVISILSVLKCGAAYLPIDPTYPTDRINTIFCDSKPKLVLTNACFKSTLHEIVKSINSSIQIQAIDDDFFQDQNATNMPTKTKSNNLAYVIYTSGSTGAPKGVMIEHKGVVNLAIALPKALKLENYNQQLKCLFFANYVFDAHVSEICIGIFAGNVLHIVDDETRYDLEKLNVYITDHCIDFAGLPPGLINTNLLLPLKIIALGGEKSNKHLLDFYSKNKIVTINWYGPTECTDTATINIYSNNGDTNIGLPITNVIGYVLSSTLKLVPKGAIGELYIGGVSLARGYLNRDKLNEDSFIQNPFQTEEEKQDKRFCESGRNSRLYKTGDLVRRLPDGDFEYIGRNDSQVKIRGFRIELGEIEAVLSSYQGVIQSYVSVKNHDHSSKNKYLIGYYVSQEKLNEDRLFNFLRTKLPDYMIPTAVVHLTKFPLNINGKIDNKALPEPTLINKNSYIAPRNEIEAQMCRIWAQVLGLSNDVVGINRDFFSMGGNSILCIKLVYKLNNQFNSNITVSDIFVNRTVEGLFLRIISRNESLIIKLNSSEVKRKMFMIHPSRAGCEVYVTLADKLKDRFCCYGVNNYNLVSNNKIDNIHDIAVFYLNEIKKISMDNFEYNMLGWSLGGQIAIEIASILENQGHNNINLILLDSTLTDEHLISLMDRLDYRTEINILRDFMLNKNFDRKYIEKIIENDEYEVKMHRENVYYKLRFTRIMLFRALKPSEYDGMDIFKEIWNYKLSLPYNNIDKVLHDVNNIQVINVDANHENLLNRHDILISKISNC